MSFSVINNAEIYLLCGGMRGQYGSPAQVSLNNPERLLQWVQATGNPQIEGLDNQQLSSKRICRKHFAPMYRTANNRLSFTAVPTLFLPCKYIFMKF